MRSIWFDTFWHRTLRRPYRLALPVNQGTGSPVLLLHGLGSSGHAWKYVARLLDGQPYHVIAPDLLGFGDSPKPAWLDYTADDHVRALIAALDRRKLQRPMIVVGHSMGCLLAVRLARQRPDLVQRLILYQMPLYSGLPDGRRYNMRRDFYFRLYKRVSQWPHERTQTGLRRAIMRMTGLKLSPATWQPFVRSLQATIMEQTTLEDMSELRLPIAIIYGSLDMVVIRGKPRAVFARVLAPLQTHTIAQVHGVSQRASKFIAKQIMAAGT